MAAHAGLFIGLGVQQPTAEWERWWRAATMCSDQWWYCAFPGAAILITPSGLICLVTAFATCWIRNREENRHERSSINH